MINNKYVGITNYDAFTKGILNNQINDVVVKNKNNNEIYIENKKAIVVKGQLADRIVTQRAAGKSVGVIAAIGDFILRIFSKDYRAAKTQAAELFGRFEKRHYANTEEGRAVYYVYQKIMTEKLQKLFGRENSVSPADMARLKKETWTLVNNNTALAKQVYTEDMEAKTNAKATAANASVETNYMAQRSRFSAPETEEEIQNKKMIQEWHAEADKRMAEYFNSKYIFTPAQAAEVRKENETNILATKKRVRKTRNASVRPTSPAKARARVKDLFTQNPEAAKPASPEKTADAVKFVTEQAEEAKAKIEAFNEAIAKAEASQKALGKQGYTMDATIADLKAQLAEQVNIKEAAERAMAFAPAAK